MLNTMNGDQAELSSQLSSQIKGDAHLLLFTGEGETCTCWQQEFVFFPMEDSDCLNGRGGKHSTENINTEVLLLDRVCSKLLHNTVFPRLVNKFAVASWRFIAKWLYPRANELVRLFPGTTSSSRCSLKKRNRQRSWAALHYQSSSINSTQELP